MEQNGGSCAGEGRSGAGGPAAAEACPWGRAGRAAPHLPFPPSLSLSLSLRLPRGLGLGGGEVGPARRGAVRPGPVRPSAAGAARRPRGAVEVQPPWFAVSLRCVCVGRGERAGMAGAGASGLAGSAARPSPPSLPRRCLPSPRLLHVSPPGPARPPQGEGPPGGRFHRGRAAAAVGVYRPSSLYLLPAPLCSFMATPAASI